MKQATHLLREALNPHYDAREVKSIIRLLLEEVCDLTYTQMVMNPDLQLTEQQRSVLEGYAPRLAAGEPVQQVMGYTWFCGRKFAVTPDVLIPRPETEELVNRVVDNYVNNPMDKCGDNPTDNPMDKGVDNPVGNPMDNPVYNLVDIGTGSGCIALTLAAEINHSFITAVDLSTGALKTAENNSKALGINNIRFVQADILKEEEEDFSTELSTAEYDAIVSNPPYVCDREAAEMDSHVLEHEPHLALFVPDEDPLLFYRVIAKYGLRHLKPGGGLYFEINAAFGRETCQLLYQLGYQQVELIKDFTGRDRIVTAINPNLDLNPNLNPNR